MFDDPRLPPMPEALRKMLEKPLPEIESQDPTAEYKTMKPTAKPPESARGVEHNGLVFCPKCHRIVCDIERKEQGYKIKQNGRTVIDLSNCVASGNTFQLNCPSGHKVGVG